MTKTVGDELIELSEIAPMSAGTRTKLRDLALKVQALEREHETLAHLGGAALGQLYQQSEPDCEWKPIGTAPIEEFVLLWWVGDGTPEPKTTFGMLSGHMPSMYWNGSQYVPLKYITHWRRLPEGPSPQNREVKP